MAQRNLGFLERNPWAKPRVEKSSENPEARLWILLFVNSVSVYYFL
jgi:hypothetical protein